MILKFKLSSLYILVHSLRRATTSVPESMVLKERARSISSTAFNYLVGKEKAFLTLSGSNSSEWYQLADEAKRLVDQCKRTAEFSTLYNETKSYKSWLAREWQSKEERLIGLVEELSGLQVPSGAIPVYVTHPGLNNGKALPSIPAICWGHPEEWPNYSIVYLTHELLHIMTEGRGHSPELLHAIIELLADNEIRIRLNGGGQYFQHAGQPVGHRHLVDFEKRILPYWREYLADGQACTIIDLEEKLLSEGIKPSTVRANAA